MNYKDVERIVGKLNVVGKHEGCELADTTRSVADFFDGGGYPEYVFGESLYDMMLTAAEKTCDDYFHGIVEDAEYYFRQNGMNYSMLTLYDLNQLFKEYELPEMWFDGVEGMDADDIEACGVCKNHPYEYYSRDPENDCVRCMRLFEKAQKEEAERQKELEARRAEREAAKEIK